ncbi:MULTISPECIES: sulfotransferase family protein [Leeuwenhoekiella]|uniref:sulfotransferase family protein n=1 Tax=Leeuwenhoekiella TaxID=283735 RepID=UPI000C4330BB|nr:MULTISPECIES: sulfotransferase [Leeuwenhoekiella]MAG85992.1 hypothetical protein [Flavobacteriaceae bacterium]MAO44989.1 hypothetical protein [Leeuwenhoekiella sp.]|tara:strand:- start:1035 stop:1919 length:885 start_codon:yes stop_codon:yes gene_type:complete
MINFICIGAQKAGTTTLHDILQQHPEIFLPNIKETHFFDKDELYNEGLDWYYHRFFSNSENKIKGEITPDYLFFEDALRRIANDLPKELKIIVVFRNPVDRAISHYQMSKRRGYESLSLTKALKEENDRITKGYFEKSNFSYITRGLYAKQYKILLNFFDKKQILPLIFETEIKQNLNLTLEKITSFINVSTFDFDTQIQSNSSKSSLFPFFSRFIMKPPKFVQVISRFFFKEPLLKYKIKVWLNSFLLRKNNYKVDSNLKRELFLEYFEKDTKELSLLIDKDLSHWLKKEEGL